MTDTIEADLLAESEYVGRLYARLDELRAEKLEQLERTRAQGAVGTFQNMSERDSFATLYEDRIAQLDAVEDRLVFGRLDMAANGRQQQPGDADSAAAPRYIGRIGLSDEDLNRLMIDWRASEAAPFYQATALNPRGVRRRRHLMLKGRSVAGIEDDVLDETWLDEGHTHHGEGALMAALREKRTGRMGDIVGTIQAEQDAIIRAELPGAVVVQGGPGTGKTAVALHRAAFLLYEYRERLKNAGVLIVGPSNSFMRYIERVLPSLGETGVVMSSVSDLYHGIHAVPEANRTVARLKGQLSMAKVIANAVRNRQRLIPENRTLVVEGTRLTLTPKMVKNARERARHTRKPYNEARETFVKVLVGELAEQLRRKLEESAGQSSTTDRSYLPQEVRESHDVRVALNLCWMPMTPQQLVAELFANPHLLAAAAPHLAEHERDSLYRRAGSPFTEADVPLLDEAAGLLGDFADPLEGARTAQYEADVENAKAALRNMHTMLQNAGIDGVVTAEQVAGVNQETAVRLTAAERAVADRTWAYGHIVVDEAQELSPMQWRLLIRRCPMKSFTIVGDIAQTSAASGASSWSQALEPFFGDRFELEELTVNYRTPAQIADAAVRVAQAAGLRITTPQAVREGDWPPVLTRTTADRVQDAVLAALREELEYSAGGLQAIIVPQQDLARIRAAVEQVYGDRVGSGSGGLSQDIVVITARESKGLEFDGVLILEPAELVDEVDGGVGDLYVAMTRTTQRLHVVHARELPEGMEA
ncbi:HelD family protein [Glutamicibacter sp. HZAU]|uniref:HelD family protein n=1 Tax=Glutamicibacter sp. HZAU TaxID=2049891 RepID=UPI000FFC0B18|nr:AAA family ATPase [Glutamicibacter sp. HZAU]RWZ79658.1 AAA family ATPase [Glutamicibacter sp. HZAU]